MGAMMALEGPDVEFTFFRGSQEELKTVVGACGQIWYVSLVFRTGWETVDRSRVLMMLAICCHRQEVCATALMHVYPCLSFSWGREN